MYISHFLCHTNALKRQKKIELNFLSAIAPQPLNGKNSNIFIMKFVSTMQNVGPFLSLLFTFLSKTFGFDKHFELKLAQKITLFLSSHVRIFNIEKNKTDPEFLYNLQGSTEKVVSW